MKFDVILLDGTTRIRCESTYLDSEDVLLAIRRSGRLCPKGHGSAIPYHAIAYIQEVVEDGS